MTYRRTIALLGVSLSVGTVAVLAQTPSSLPPGASVPKRLPPPGIAIPDGDRAELTAGVAALGSEISALKTRLKDKPELMALLPDVQIYHKAVLWALEHNEFFSVKEAETAKALLAQGRERARQLAGGSAPWTTQTGLVARGYISKIDGSVQPYGLVVPEDWDGTQKSRRRLDVFFHGRDDKLTDLRFIDGRQKSKGEFTPPGAFVLHPYGRMCNANRFAGEVDLFEALDSVKSRYPIDDDRLIVRGFSMGGAACWQYATHHAGLWAGAAPGAGFSESPQYTGAFAAGKTPPPWYEQKLWRLYDSTEYAANLFNCPTIAYSGELDKQKQAADKMAEAMKAEGLDLVHIIGPKTAHRYHADSKPEINRYLDAAATKGRNRVPTKVRFTTWTLRYNKMLWVTVDGLEKHWDRRARVDAVITSPKTVTVTTENVSALTLSMPPGLAPLETMAKPIVVIDGSRIVGPAVGADRSWTARFVKKGDAWAAATASKDATTLRKRHGLQGPMDDAFYDAFLFVRPTGAPLNPVVGAWATAQADGAAGDWRAFFRGDAPVKEDRAVTDADIAERNLVLWGDPSSNTVLAKIASRLPVRWDRTGVRVGDRLYPAGTHVPALIYPNPLNLKRYVLINSSFTFRDFMSASNAQHAPKLPDWAVFDVSVGPTPAVRTSGYVVHAGFFDENWKLPPETK